MSYLYHSHKIAFKTRTHVSICYKIWSTKSAAFWGCTVLALGAFYSSLVAGKKILGTCCVAVGIPCARMVMTIKSANEQFYAMQEKIVWKVMVFMYNFFFCVMLWHQRCPDLHVDMLWLFSSIFPQNQVTDTNRKLQNEGKEVSDSFIHSVVFCFSFIWLCSLVANYTEHQ